MKLSKAGLIDVTKLYVILARISRIIILKIT